MPYLEMLTECMIDSLLTCIAAPFHFRRPWEEFSRVFTSSESKCLIFAEYQDDENDTSDRYKRSLFKLSIVTPAVMNGPVMKLILDRWLSQNQTEDLTESNWKM